MVKRIIIAILALSMSIMSINGFDSDGGQGKCPHKSSHHYGKTDKGWGKDCPLAGAEFCREGYLQENPDVANDSFFCKRPYMHYFMYGRDEGRSTGDYACHGLDDLAATPDDFIPEDHPTQQPEEEPEEEIDDQPVYEWPLPKFQLGISFYNGHHAPGWQNQLHAIKAQGFNHVRIFANRFNPHGAGFTIFDGTGALTNEIKGTVEFIKYSNALGMTVNVTFWRRYESGLRSDEPNSFQPYAKGIVNAVRYLYGAGLNESQFYVDLGNEFNDPIDVGGHLSSSEVIHLINMIKKEFPKLMLTASFSGWMDTRNASRYAASTKMDILSYHEHRGAGRWRWHEMDKVVAELSEVFKGPVFFDEPATSDYDKTGGRNLETVTTERLQTAYRGAKTGGAMQWVLHTHACWPPNFPGLSHSGTIPTALEEPERGFFYGEK